MPTRRYDSERTAGFVSLEDLLFAWDPYNAHRGAAAFVSAASWPAQPAISRGRTDQYPAPPVGRIVPFTKPPVRLVAGPSAPAHDHRAPVVRAA